MKSPLVSPTALAIYLIFFSIGVIGALVFPSFSLFLAAELQVRPLLVGLPFAGMAIASILYNMALGSWSDNLPDRRKLIALLCLMSALACATFALSRHYWIVATVATMVFSLSMVSFSQMLAYSLDFAEANVPADKVPLFNSIVRAQIAFAWVIGPPLGFILVEAYGFSVAYFASAGLSVLLIAALFLCLPNIRSAKQIREANSILASQLDHHASLVQTPSTGLGRVNSALVFCVIGFSLFWGVNNAYLIGLPIHLTEDLKFAPSWMGWIMGTTAAFEVPFMILAGIYAARVPLMRLIYGAGIAAIILYAGVYVADEIWHFFALQFFNAAFVGILAGLGVSVVQRLLPGESGRASAIYTNTSQAGNLISSLVVSVVADMAGYAEVFLVNVVLALIAIACFSRIRFPKTDN